MQFSLFALQENIIENPCKKRMHNKIPTFIKFYTVFQYDRLEFRRLLNIRLEKEKKENLQPTLEERKQICEELMKKCYIKDEYGNIMRDSDEPSIYRYATMQKIYELLYNYAGIDPFLKDGTLNIDGLICHIDEKQAEIQNSWQLPLRQRLKLHIKLLRSLRKKKTIKEAIKELCPIAKSVK